MAIRRRTVTGKVEKPHESWEGGTVTFRLRLKSFTADALFPEATATVLTDEDGAFSVSLWCDEDGLTPTEYRAWMPGQTLSGTHAFRFDLSYGDGSPISLETILATETVPYTPSTAAILQAIVDAEGAAREAADALLQPLSEKNQANGYAGLDGSGLIADIRLPASIARDSEVTSAVAAEATARDAAISTASSGDRARSNHTGTQVASTISDFAAAVDARVQQIVGAAPAALDTLDELAAALGDDSNFAATVATSLAGKQGLHANLTALSGLTFAADKLPYATAPGSLALADLTAFGRSLLDDANQAAAQATLGLGTGDSPSFTALTVSGLTAGKVPVAGAPFTDSPLTVSGTSIGLNKASGIGAQLHVQSGAAGTKGLIVQMAATPSARPLELQDSAGTAVFSVETNGQANPAKVFLPATDAVLSVQGGGFSLNVSAGNVTLGSTWLLKWSSDLSVSRPSAGIFQVGDGGSNANGTVRAARFQFSATLTPSGSADVQGNAGDVRYDDDHLYVKTAGGWKRAALATF